MDTSSLAGGNLDRQNQHSFEFDQHVHDQFHSLFSQHRLEIIRRDDRKDVEERIAKYLLAAENILAISIAIF
jgi:hypothetical protein